MVYLLRHKSDVFVVFKKFKQMVEKQSSFEINKYKKSWEETKVENTPYWNVKLSNDAGLERQLTVAYTLKKMKWLKGK